MKSLLELNKPQTINRVISDLTKLRQTREDQQYAIDQNIAFFEATRSLPKYLYWLITKYPKIDPRRILELADFNLSNGLWQQTLLHQLMNLEKNPFDVIRPLRSEIVQTLQYISKEATEPMVIINIGCGGMEIERQVTAKITTPLQQSIIFIGIDNSPVAGAIARKNLKNTSGSFKILDDLTTKTISSIREDSTLKAINFFFYEGDAIQAINHLSRESIDINIIFHSKFHHHLTDENKNKLDITLQLTARHVIEFDDYRGLYLPILSLLTGWNKPVLLNGAVLSSVRDYKIKDLKKRHNNQKWQIKIFPMKGYIRTFSQQTQKKEV